MYSENISGKELNNKNSQANEVETRIATDANFLEEIRKSFVKNPRFKTQSQTYDINSTAISLFTIENRVNS